jgi:hypothetical protein
MSFTSQKKILFWRKPLFRVMITPLRQPCPRLGAGAHCDVSLITGTENICTVVYRYSSTIATGDALAAGSPHICNIHGSGANPSFVPVSPEQKISPVPPLCDKTIP